MTLIKPFRALRPAPGRAVDVLAPPYDVLSSAEARERAKGKPWSFLHISKPEIDLDPATDPYDRAVYAKATDNLQRMVASGVLKRDDKPCYYVYRLTWRDRVQTGLAAAASVADYQSNRIRRHDYGFNIGGPIKIPHLYNGENKSFFFFNWEQYRDVQKGLATTIPTVPTDLYRKGDFSGLFAVTNNANLSRGTATLSTNALPFGAHTITVTYGGDVHVNTGNKSITYNVVVEPTQTIIGVAPVNGVTPNPAPHR